MEIRCGSCNKLFRVADEKITGSGVKFKCTRCGEYVKITREDFEHYNLSKAAAPALSSFEPVPPVATFETTQPEAISRESSPVVQPVKVPEPLVPPVAEAPHVEPALPETKPEIVPEPSHIPYTEQPEESGREPAPVVPPAKGPEPMVPPVEAAPHAEPASPVTQQPPGPEPGHMLHEETAAKPMPEAKPVTVSKPAPLRPSTPLASQTERAPSPVRPAPTAAEVIAAGPLPRPSSGKKYLILVLLTLVLGVATVFILRTAGYNVFRFIPSASNKVEVTTKAMTSPEGLQITSASGSLDQNQDLIISGVVANTTDKEKAAWYIVVDVFDAQGTVLIKARMLNGKELYTKRDYEVLAKRGANVQELKAKALQNPGVVIPPKGSVPFEIRFLEPPIGIASFNASLQPFDPEQLFKEIAEEQK